MDAFVTLTHVQVRRSGETRVGRTGGQSARVHEPAVDEQTGLRPAQCYGHGVPMPVGQTVREHFGVHATAAPGHVV